MPFTCEACGSRSDLIPAVGDVLQCPRCKDERPFVRPPLLVVTGTCGIGKSTLCARLAGTIAGAVLLDGDIHAEDLVSVVAPNEDYPAFWRSMLRLAHELAQNDLAVVYFSTMLPQQLLSNDDLLGYFSSVRFLCLTCPPDVLRARLERRAGTSVDRAVERWTDFNRSLEAAASELADATLLDTARPVDEIEADVRRWIERSMSDAVGVAININARDAKALIQWMQDVLGFELVALYLDLDDDHVRASRLKLGNHAVHVSQRAASDTAPRHGVGIGVTATDEAAVDSLYDRSVAAGAEIVSAPEHAMTGSYRFAVRDPEGDVWQVSTTWHDKPESLQLPERVI